MKRRVLPWSILLGLGLGSLPMLAGCDYSSTAPPPLTINDSPSEAATNTEAGKDQAASTTPLAIDNGDPDMKPVILESVINLIQTAAIKPGGANFEQATTKLNNYFEGTKPDEYLLSKVAREFVLTQFPAESIKVLERPTFELPDARHLEDCMLYHGIATRIGGTGDDLTRVRRLFDWMIRQVVLVPPQSLAVPGIGQAQARPYDVLLRGMATEGGGSWSERGWLFMSLCRQLGIDVGILTYTPAESKDETPWVSAVLIDHKLYLFDHRIGLAIPGPDGNGVATLEDALNDPKILDRLDLPGESPYPVNRKVLLESPSKIGVLLDSSPGYLSPRMLLLQKSLVGKNRTVLFRDPADQRDQFASALGTHAGKVSLWNLPVMVVNRLFTDPKFVQATQQALLLFDSRFPLLYARIKQLRGDVPDAIQSYMTMRYAEGATVVGGKDPIHPEIQSAIDHYSAYFLALAHLERQDTMNAERFFTATLRNLPAPGANQPYFFMFRWGAQTNLAYLLEAKKLNSTAIAYYTESNPTTQYHGNLLLARELVWRNPTAAPPMPLPPAPRPEQEAQQAPSGFAPIDLNRP
ncbi:hypothetical protein [Singulisphaera sp. PoT]|uniref:hypothetical protein n=1 Tax=Singulisphaera sp. PoT TaxID=3411797 RepID=UPI003BF565F6